MYVLVYKPVKMTGRPEKEAFSLKNWNLKKERAVKT